MAVIRAVCISEKKGTAKKNIKEAEIIQNFGLKDDAHAGNWHRQVSLLSYEKIEEFKALGVDVKDGDFGENLIVEGIDLSKLPIGTKMTINEVLLEVTQIGKECHTGCAIAQAVGKCIMPTEGIFARVLKGGHVKVGDSVFIE
ncbi:MAG: MOSC domain-containing protein [Firmicutes bacterium]|nr:MOSC domain-containing protein [Bacillota bacterium]